MTKFVLDSDGLIKLTKSGVIEVVLDRFECFIPEDVQKENVTSGIERLYEDAFQIESFIQRKLLTVSEFKEDENAKSILKDVEGFGIGEISTLHLFFNLRASAIISDDYAFLKLLHRNEIPFIIPTDLIARMAELNILTKESALTAMETIKPYVKKDNYQIAKRNILDIK